MGLIRPYTPPRDHLACGAAAACVLAPLRANTTAGGGHRTTDTAGWSHCNSKPSSLCYSIHNTHPCTHTHAHTIMYPRANTHARTHYLSGIHSLAHTHAQIHPPFAYRCCVPSSSCYITQCTHTLAHTLYLSLTHLHTHTQRLSIHNTLFHTHSHTHTCAHIDTHTLYLSHIPTHTHARAKTLDT